VNDQFGKWLQNNYREHREVAIHWGKKHDYLGMELGFSKKGKVKIGMIKYVEGRLEDFPEKIKSTDTVDTPASDGLFNEGQGNKLNKEHADAYHMMVAKALFLCKRARPDIQPTIAVLCTRVKGPNKADLATLVRLMKYLNGTMRAGPDVRPTIAVLCTRVKGPNKAHSATLVRLMKYLNGTR
jgi:hypothetical protein